MWRLSGVRNVPNDALGTSSVPNASFGTSAAPPATLLGPSGEVMKDAFSGSSALKASFAAWSPWRAVNGTLRAFMAVNVPFTAFQTPA